MGYGRFLLVNVLCSERLIGYDYFVTFSWILLRVSVLQSDLKIPADSGTSLQALSSFIGVVATRNLLSYVSSADSCWTKISHIQTYRYLETGVSNYDLQPWVWIVLLGSGPFISACIFTQFLYVGVSLTYARSQLRDYFRTN